MTEVNNDNAIRYEDVLIDGEKPTGPIALASPNKMVCEHFSTIQDIINEIAVETDGSKITRKSALTLHLSVLAIETFFNIYFYILVKNSGKAESLEKIKKAFQERKSIEWKLKHFPQIAFGKSLDLTKGPGYAFCRMKEDRNSIMHFKYSDSRLSAPGMNILGLADVAFYSHLNIQSAEGHLNAAVNLLWEIFRLRGMNKDQIIENIHRWAGIILPKEYVPH